MNRLSKIGSASRPVLVAYLLLAGTWSASAQDSRRKPKDDAPAVQSPAESTSAVEKQAEPSADEKSTPAKDEASKDAVTLKEPERVYKSDEEWRKILTYDQYLVTRMKATEPAFSGRYAAGHFKGTFLCVCCGAKLFDSKHKFDSGTGWPSFWRPVAARSLDEAVDRSEAEPRMEVTCSRCGAHLGHVFSDGPPPTGLRYCINSLAIKLDSEPTRPAVPPRRSSSRRKAPATREARPEAPEGHAPAEDAPKSKPGN